MRIQRKTPAFAEHIILNALCRKGTAEDVLKQFLKCGYDNGAMSSRFYSFDGKPRFIEKLPPLPHPFVTACEHGNIPVVKLFMLFGMRANVEIMEDKKKTY